MTPRRVSLSVLLLGVLAACSSGGGDGDGPGEGRARPQPTTTTTEGTRAGQFQAEGLVLSIDDFTAGWRQEEDTTDDEAFDLGECSDLADALRGESIGRAESGFERDSVTVRNVVAVYASDAEAAAVMDTWRLDRLGPCLEDAVQLGIEQEGGNVEDATAGRLSVDPNGDDTLGWEVALVVEDTDAYIDVVMVREANVVTQFNFSDVFSPFFEIEEVMEPVLIRMPCGEDFELCVGA